MPGLTPARRMTSSASPTRSRASSVEKLSPTIGERSRWAAGNGDLEASCRHPARATTANRAMSGPELPPRQFRMPMNGSRLSPRQPRMSFILFDILDLDPLAGDALRQSRGHEPVEIAVEHVERRGRGHAGAQILDQLVGLKDIAADLVAPADVGLRRGAGVGLGLAFLQLGLIETGAKLVHRLGLVLVLRSLVLALDDDVGRQVGDPDRAVGGVDVLPAGARRAIGIDAQVALVDLDVDILVDDRIDPDRGEAGVAPRGRIIGADAD